MDRFKKELAMAVGILASAVALFAVSGDYDATVPSSADALGPLFWPRVVLGIIIVMSFVSIGKIIYREKYGSEEVTQDAVTTDGSVADATDTDGGVVTEDVSDEQSDSAAGQDHIEEVEQEIMDLDQQNDLHFVGTIVLTGAYIVLLESIGFLFLTPVFLTAIFWMLGYRHVVKTPLIAIVATLVLIGLFQKVMLVPLPRGTGIFRELSYTLIG